MLMMRDSNRGGGLNPIATTQQIIERCARMILLVNELNTTNHEGNQQLFKQYTQVKVKKQHKMQQLGVSRRCKTRAHFAQHLDVNVEIANMVNDEIATTNSVQIETNTINTSDSAALLQNYNVLLDTNEMTSQAMILDDDYSMQECEQSMLFVASDEFALLNENDNESQI